MEASRTNKRNVVLLIIASSVVLIVSTYYLRPDPEPEWKKSNPPETAFLGNTDSDSYYISTGRIRKHPDGNVEAVVLMTPLDNEVGREKREETMRYLTRILGAEEAKKYTSTAISIEVSCPSTAEREIKGYEDFLYGYRVTLRTYMGSDRPIHLEYGEKEILEGYLPRIKKGSIGFSQAEAACWLATR